MFKVTFHFVDITEPHITIINTILIGTKKHFAGRKGHFNERQVRSKENCGGLWGGIVRWENWSNDSG
jgi:hypothetical protein